MKADVLENFGGSKVAMKRYNDVPGRGFRRLRRQYDLSCQVWQGLGGLMLGVLGAVLLLLATYWRESWLLWGRRSSGWG